MSSYDRNVDALKTDASTLVNLQTLVNEAITPFLDLY